MGAGPVTEAQSSSSVGGPMLAIRRLAQLVAAVARLPTLDPLGSGFDRSAATAEHLFEGAQRPQQIRADGAVVAGHDTFRASA